MDHREIILILARGSNGVIGDKGGLPWHLPADLRHFKALTQGKPMIMGRRTFDSLPGLLSGRRHIVLTRDKKWSEDGAEVAHSPDAAIKLANAPHIAVIGGAEIFKLFLPRADRIELTAVDWQTPGDTVLTDFDLTGWRETAREAHAAEGGRPGFAFVTLVRG